MIAFRIHFGSEAQRCGRILGTGEEFAGFTMKNAIRVDHEIKERRDLRDSQLGDYRVFIYTECLINQQISKIRDTAF